MTELSSKMREYDKGETGKIKIYHFINVLKHNYPHIFDDETLVGLQFDLESLNLDGCVDYEEFSRIFLQKEQQTDLAFKLEKRHQYKMQDFEELLSKISDLCKRDKIDVHSLFKKIAQGHNYLTYDQLKTALTLIDYPLSDQEFELLVHFADENREGAVSAYDLANEIQFARAIAPSFDLNKWLLASRELEHRFHLLELVYERIDSVRDALNRDGPSIGVITGAQF